MYPDSGYKWAHVQLVCTRPFSHVGGAWGRGYHHGITNNVHVYVHVHVHVHVHCHAYTCTCMPSLSHTLVSKVWKLTEVIKASEIDPMTIFPSIPPIWATPEQAAALSFDFPDTSVK